MTDCIFCRIAAGEIETDFVYEDDQVVAFRDLNPQAPTHVLVIPRGAYVNFDHFAQEASEAEIVDFTRAIGEICRMLGVDPGAGGAGYRLLANSGEDAIQEVPHMHVHIVGGRNLGRMLQPAG